MGGEGLEATLLLRSEENSRKNRGIALCFLLLLLALTAAAIKWIGVGDDENGRLGMMIGGGGVVESEEAVVAADDSRCSEIGAFFLKKGGHAVDAAVATALCLGVVCPMSSGIGGGAFMVVRSSSLAATIAIDMRETAPSAASQNMYETNAGGKYRGAMSMGIPGEIAGLHVAWLKYGRIPWSVLFEPAIKLAKQGFIVTPYLGQNIAKQSEKIMADPGLRHVLAPNGELLKAGDMCYNLELGNTLRAIAEEGPEVLYNGDIGERLIEDVKKGGGILTMEDLRNYRVNVTDAVAVHAMGYTLLGMPPPSSGTLGLSLVLKVLENYGNRDGVEGLLGMHRMIEAIKHMFAVRMNLGDPDFVDISEAVGDMLSSSFASMIQRRIDDNTTFPPEYYLPRWSQLRDYGTSHFCVVDADRNAVSMTTSVNYPFGGGVLSPSTGIVLNNEMDDFSTPTEISPDHLPPAPANFIKPNKRPLSSMTPIIVLKEGRLAGVIGGAGGADIIAGVLQVFINHFILGMDPLAAVESPRIYHRLIPNVVSYENWTVASGEHIEVSGERLQFLRERKHQVKAKVGGAICQLVVQKLISNNVEEFGRKMKNEKLVVEYHGLLTAVSDPRKGGWPAGV